MIRAAQCTPRDRRAAKNTYSNQLNIVIGERESWSLRFFPSSLQIETSITTKTQQREKKQEKKELELI